MKNKLDCTIVNREALADHLHHNEIVRSEATGEASIYHCQGHDDQSIAIALPGDSAVIVRIHKSVPNTLDRRRARR